MSTTFCDIFASLVTLDRHGMGRTARGPHLEGSGEAMAFRPRIKRDTACGDQVIRKDDKAGTGLADLVNSLPPPPPLTPNADAVPPYLV